MYDAANTPRWLSPKTVPGGKVIFQYRKFQVLQGTFFLSLGRQSMVGADQRTAGSLDDDSKAAGRRALTYALINHAALAGAMGLPGVAAVQFLVQMVAMAFGDDDEPWDKAAQNLKIRRGLENMGIEGDAADLLLHGVFTTLGTNMTNQTGAGTVLSVAPFAELTEADNAYANFDKAITAGLGPTMGLGRKWASAMGNLYSGNYLKALEQALPNGFANIARTYRYNTQGETSANQDLAIAPEDFDLGDSFWTLMGLRPERVHNRWAIQGAVKSYETRFSTRTGALKRQYAEAQSSGNRKDLRRIRAEWMDLQQAKRAAGFNTAPLSDIIKATAEKAKRERQTLAGVKWDTGSRRAVQDIAGTFGQ
jgi:hypothetical protein